MAATAQKRRQLEERERLAGLGLKKCHTCKHTIPVDAFGKGSREWDGLKGSCKLCRKYQSSSHYENNRDHVLARCRSFYQKNKTAILIQHKSYQGSISQICATEGCGNKAHSKVQGSICTSCLWRLENWGGVCDSDRVEVDWPKGDRHYAWLGDQISYAASHARIFKARGRATTHLCVDCGGGAQDWSYRGLSDKELVGPTSGSSVCAYSPDPDDYEPRCKPCHRKYDNFLQQLATTSRIAELEDALRYLDSNHQCLT